MTSAQIAIMATIILYLCLVIFTGVMIGKRSKKGRCDVAIIHDVHWEKNAYYDKKRKFIEKVYKCCIKLQLVDYEEIINEEIV